MCKSSRDQTAGQSTDQSMADSERDKTVDESATKRAKKVSEPVSVRHWFYCVCSGVRVCACVLVVKKM